LAAQGRATEAEAQFLKAIELDNNAAYLRSNYALFLEEQKRGREAEGQHQMALNLAPKAWNMHAKSAVSLALHDQMAEAEQMLEKAIELGQSDEFGPEDGEVLLEWFCSVGKAEQTVGMIKKLAGPDSASQAVAGFVMFEAEQYQDAAQLVEQLDLAKVAQETKTFVQALETACCAKSGDAAKARASLRQFKSPVMKQSSIWYEPTIYLMGRTHEYLGDTSAATQCYQKVLRTWRRPVADFYRVKALEEFVAAHQ